MAGRDQHTIMIVAERHPVPDLSTAFLRQPDISLTECDPGDRAFDLARRDPPSLIVEEVRAREERELALCQRLKSDPDTRRIPLIVVGHRGSLRKARQAGADRLLVKPVGPQELFEVVREYVPLPERQHPRHAFNLRCTFEINGRSFQVFSRNISLSGAFLKTDCFVPHETRIDLQFYLPGEAEPVVCPSVVKRPPDLDEQQGRRGIGVEFRQVPEPALTRLEAFFERNAPRSRFRR